MDKFAAILSVGDEILSGRTVNTNASWIAEKLTDQGIEVKRMVVVGDEIEKIAKEVGKLSSKFDFLFVIGGIGPTPDDKTRDGVARGLNSPLIQDEKALEMIINYYNDSLNPHCRRMALIPQGGEVIGNEAGAAPGFKVGNVYVLPGVPQEMKVIFNAVKNRFCGEKFHRESLVTEIGESVLAEFLKIAGEKFPDVSFGSYPRKKEDGNYIVELVIKSRRREEIVKAKDFLSGKINNL